MNKLVKIIGDVAVNTGAKIAVWGKKRSPELLMIAGLGSIAGATYLAIKETRKANAVCDEMREEREEIKASMETENEELQVSEEEGAKMLAKNYATQVVKMGKIYGPAITLGAAGVFCILASNKIIRERHANLVLAYNALEKGFDGYRSRVKEQFGEEVEEMIHYDLKKEKREKTVVDEATGKTKKVKEEVTVSEGEHNTGSAYDCLFAEYTNPNWSTSHVYNMAFLTEHRNSAQWEIDKNSRGMITLVSVLNAMGFTLSKEQYKKLSPYGWENGDNIDFGIRENASNATYRYINGLETECVLLSFNAKRLW